MLESLSIENFKTFGEKVTIEHILNGYTRIQTDMGKLFVIPSHILKEIA